MASSYGEATEYGASRSSGGTINECRLTACPELPRGCLPRVEPVVSREARETPDTQGLTTEGGGVASLEDLDVVHRPGSAEVEGW